MRRAYLYHLCLSDLEWIALYFVPLAIAEMDQATPLAVAAAVSTFSQSDILISGERKHKLYEEQRTNFIKALAWMAYQPGGWTFGRLHFEASHG
jgi:hypothetical protein